MKRWRERYRKKVDKMTPEQLAREHKRNTERLKKYRSEKFRDLFALRMTGLVFFVGYAVMYALLYVSGVSHQRTGGKIVLCVLTGLFLWNVKTYLKIYFETRDSDEQ